LDLPDFYFTGEDYRYRVNPEAKRRFLDLLRKWFNSGTTYKDHVLKWDTVIEQKVIELGSFLLGRSATFDVARPAPTLHGTDNQNLRRRVRRHSQPAIR
jgi:hypothetical protein